MSAYQIEYSKSARASCVICKNVIDKGALRVGFEQTLNGNAMMRWTHASCWKVPRALTDLSTIQGYDALKDQDKEFLYSRMPQDKEKAAAAPTGAKRKASNENDATDDDGEGEEAAKPAAKKAKPSNDTDTGTDVDEEEAQRKKQPQKMVQNSNNNNNNLNEAIFDVKKDSNAMICVLTSPAFSSSSAHQLYNSVCQRLEKKEVAELKEFQQGNAEPGETFFGQMPTDEIRAAILVCLEEDRDEKVDMSSFDECLKILATTAKAFKTKQCRFQVGGKGGITKDMEEKITTALAKKSITPLYFPVSPPASAAVETKAATKPFMTGVSVVFLSGATNQNSKLLKELKDSSGGGMVVTDKWLTFGDDKSTHLVVNLADDGNEDDDEDNVKKTHKDIVASDLYNHIKKLGGKIVTIDWLVECNKKKAKVDEKPFLYVPPAGLVKQSQPSQQQQPSQKQQSQAPPAPAATAATAPAASASTELKIDENILPNIFKSMVFGFDGVKDERMTRYIIAYDGDVVEFPNGKITHLISAKKWSKTYDNLLETNKDIKICNADFLWECIKETKRVKERPFLVPRHK